MVPSSHPGYSPRLSRIRKWNYLHWFVPLLLCMGGSASAKDYRVELILFENLQQTVNVGPGNLYYPQAEEAVELDSSEARADGFTHLADNALTLNRVAGRVAATSRYRLLMHTAWQQPGLDDQSAVALRFNLGESFELYLPDGETTSGIYLPAKLQPEPEYGRPAESAQLIGNLKVRLGRFLHMDVDMVFTDIAAGRSYRLTQSRKMRSRELHYIDNERFGLLTLITPVEDSAPADEPGPANTTEPVTPAPDYEALPTANPGDATE